MCQLLTSLSQPWNNMELWRHFLLTLMTHIVILYVLDFFSWRYRNHPVSLKQNKSIRRIMRTQRIDRKLPWVWVGLRRPQDSLMAGRLWWGHWPAADWSDRLLSFLCFSAQDSGSEAGASEWLSLGLMAPNGQGWVELWVGPIILYVLSEAIPMKEIRLLLGRENK